MKKLIEIAVKAVIEERRMLAPSTLPAYGRVPSWLAIANFWESESLKPFDSREENRLSFVIAHVFSTQGIEHSGCMVHPL